MGSSQTRAQTRVPCIGRQILNQCATREAQGRQFKIFEEQKESPGGPSAMSKGGGGRGEGQRDRQGSDRVWQAMSRALDFILRSVESLLPY